MDRNWSVVPKVAVALVVAIGIVSCATPRGGGDLRANEHKIKIEYDAKKANKTDRIKVKKDNGGNSDAFNRCSDNTDATCLLGHPVDADGLPILGTITAEDGNRRDLNEVYFVSDAASPGRTCVCYGNRCYCN